MSGYRRKWEYVTKFEGDKVSMTLTGMKRKHLHRLTKYIVKGDDGSINIGFENQMEAFEAFADVLPECVLNLSGLKEVDGTTEIPLDVILEDIYFINLVSEMIRQVMSSSTMSSAEIQEVKKPQGDQQRVLRTGVAVE